MYEFNTSINEGDYLLFNQYHLLNSAAGKKTLKSYRSIIIYVCLILFISLCIIGSGFQFILIKAIVMTILSIFLISNSDKMALKSFEKNLLKMKKEGKLPYNSEAILKFDDEGVCETAPKSENRIKYSLIEKVVATEKAIYMYVNPMQAIILPVSAFSDEMEKLNFLEFINLKVDNCRD